MIWNGDFIKERLRIECTQRIATAAAQLQDAAKQNIGIQGPPRSTAGNFPHRDTGNLQENVVAIHGETASQVFASVGTSVPYGPHLEFGTEKMAARPWLKRTTEEQRTSVVETLTAKT